MDAKLIAAIVANLTPDLLPNDFWRRKNRKNPMAGHCYVASEVYFHLSSEIMKPCVVRVNREITHWFLENIDTGERVDITAAQFKSKSPPYEKAKGCGFLTKQPSKRAAILIARVLIWRRIYQAA